MNKIKYQKIRKPSALAVFWLAFDNINCVFSVKEVSA